MEISGGQKDKPQLTKEQRMQTVGNLSKQFGSSSEIPEEALSAIGYVRRVMEDGTIRLLPHERIEELAQKNPDWDKPLKIRERPFDRLAIELPTVEQSFRFIPREQRELLLDKLQGVEYAFYPNWHDGTSITGEANETDQRMQNLRTFSLGLREYLKKEGINGKEIPVKIVEGFIFGALPIRRESEETPNDPNDFSDFTFRKKYAEPDGSIKSVATRQMYDELTRLGSYFGDIPELTKDFERRLANPLVPENKQQSQQDLVNDLEIHGIHTYADFIRYTFPHYLESIGLSEMGAVIRTNTALHTVAETLQYMDTSDNYRAEEMELRKALKIATPEERNILSKKISDIENMKKRKRQIRQGVIDYFSSPQVYADVIKRKVKDAKDFFIAGKNEQKGHSIFYFDATPNEKLDSDPGAVSGDCTVGRPLPFDKEDIPLYNVKVFAHDGQHIGNMYLLVSSASTDASKEKKVWHFDAIQLPISGINWQESLSVMFEALSKQAETKGIDAITANSELHHISNYDYIAKATEDYWKANGRQMIDVTIPNEEESGYSSLQGTGKAIVLWSKEKMSESYEDELEVNQANFDQQNNQ